MSSVRDEQEIKAKVFNMQDDACDIVVEIIHTPPPGGKKGKKTPHTMNSL